MYKAMHLTRLEWLVLFELQAADETVDNLIATMKLVRKGEANYTKNKRY